MAEETGYFRGKMVLVARTPNVQPHLMEIRGKALLILIVSSLKISGALRNLNLDIRNFFLLPVTECVIMTFQQDYLLCVHYVSMHIHGIPEASERELVCLSSGMNLP